MSSAQFNRKDGSVSGFGSWKTQGVTNVHLSNAHFVLRDISALLDPSWGS